MPPPVAFGKDKILREACALVEENGLGALTARSLAARLSSSTAPIYGSFASIQELRQAVIEHAYNLLLEYTHRSYSERPFLNQGTGIVVFAREHREYFRILFLTPDISPSLISHFYNNLVEDMKSDVRFTDFSREKRILILQKLWYMAVGMATLAFEKQLPDNSDQYVVATLLETGNILIPDAIGRLGGLPNK